MRSHHTFRSSRIHDEIAYPPDADAATPGLRVMSGAGVSDTIDARLGTPVIVELRDSTGRAMPAAVLHVGVAVTPPAYFPNAVVARSPAGPSVTSYVDTTDASGRASIYVGLGRQAGTTGITVRTADARWQTEASFNPGALTLMRPDGTNREVIPTGTVGFNPGFAWSPDGKYIVARASTGLLAVVVVATGEVLPLPFSGDLYLPDWKP